MSTWAVVGAVIGLIAVAGAVWWYRVVARHDAVEGEKRRQAQGAPTVLTLTEENALLRDELALIHHRLWAIIGGVFVIACLVMAISYFGRDDLRNSQIDGCNRSRESARLQGEAWRQAQMTRQATADNRNVDADERRVARRAAVTYDRVATLLELRAIQDCESLYPAPEIIPFADAAMPDDPEQP